MQIALGTHHRAGVRAAVLCFISVPTEPHLNGRAFNTKTAAFLLGGHAPLQIASEWTFESQSPHSTPPEDIPNVNVSMFPSSNKGRPTITRSFKYSACPLFEGSKKRIPCRKPIPGMNPLRALVKWSTWFSARSVWSSANTLKSSALIGRNIYSKDCAHRCLVQPMACQWSLTTGPFKSSPHQSFFSFPNASCGLCP